MLAYLFWHRPAAGVDLAIYEGAQRAFHAAIPTGVEWLDKPRGEASQEFVASLPQEGVWRRQLVLGPAPEFCCSAKQSSTRTHI